MSKVDSFMEQIRKHRIENILKKGETIRESDVYCPYCAHEQDSTYVWDSKLEPNGSEHDYECSSCGETFIIEAEVLFSTSKKPESSHE